MAGQAATGGKLYGPPLTTKYENLEVFADFEPSDIPRVKPAKGSAGLVRAPARLGWQVCTAYGSRCYCRPRSLLVWQVGGYVGGVRLYRRKREEYATLANTWQLNPT